MSAPRCPKCGRPLKDSLGLLQCARQACSGIYYELAPGGRLRVSPDPVPDSPAMLEDDPLVDTVADRWTPDMAASSILGAKR